MLHKGSVVHMGSAVAYRDSADCIGFACRGFVVRTDFADMGLAAEQRGQAGYRDFEVGTDCSIVLLGSFGWGS